MTDKILVQNVVNSLKAQGYNFSIQHNRYIPDEMDCMTRGEFEKYQELNAKIGIPYKHFADCVSPTYGFTRVVITKDGQTFVGKKNFGKKENYNKRVGAYAALHMALGLVHHKSN